MVIHQLPNAKRPQLLGADDNLIVAVARVAGQRRAKGPRSRCSATAPGERRMDTSLGDPRCRSTRIFAEMRCPFEGRESSTHGTHHTARSVSEYRHHGPHRCREDDDDRAHSVLHGEELQNRRGARRHRDDGLDGAGAGARHHDHVGRDDLLSGRRQRRPSTASTSSTRRATWTSRSKSSGRCACSTAR